MERDSAIAEGTDIERYHLEQKLGEGGMAAVYRARHRDLGSLHAVKVLHTGGRGVRARLLLEGRAQATLRHPNIVPVTDIIDANGAPGLVMDLIEGPPLDRLIDQRELTWDEIDGLARGILRGVGAAHKKGLIHRDLKPANILVALEDGELVPKVADFGLVKALEEAPGAASNTRTGLAMGTPAYMAPEQIRDAKHVDKRADIWSLGAILYELVTRTRMFPQGEMLPTFIAVSTARHVAVRDLRPDAPDRMVVAIAAAVQVEAEDRVPDCEALLELWMGRASAPVRRAPSPTHVPRPRSEPTLPPLDSFGPEAPPEVAEALSRAPEEGPASPSVEVPSRSFSRPAVAALVGVGGLVAAAVAAFVIQSSGGPPAPEVEEPPATEPAAGTAGGAPPAAPASAPPAPSAALAAAPVAEPAPAHPAAASGKPAPKAGSSKPSPTPVAEAAAVPAAAPADSEVAVRVSSYPLGARVMLFGHELCARTPCDVKLPIGTHMAEFSLADGRNQLVPLVVTPETHTFGHKFAQ